MTWIFYHLSEDKMTFLYSKLLGFALTCEDGYFWKIMVDLETILNSFFKLKFNTDNFIVL